jgi:N-methylhydantoinase B/oxoprolinase/acetone carboxylase alpha subunit
VLFSKVTQEVCKAGDVLEIRLPSGGGFGDPLARDPQAVLDDVEDEYLTAEDARRDYGVVLDTGSWTVDEVATRELRSARAAA